MNTIHRDLNALYLFGVLYEELNLSRAADRMALSQPALSHRLNKLRAEFKDPLFIRAPRGLATTPTAELYAPQIMALVAQIDAFYQSTQQHDFLQQEAKVSIFGTEIVETFLIPNLLTTIRQPAPNTQIALFNTRGKLPRAELEKGICDIAIAGFYEDIPDSFYSQSLCSYRFVVLSHQDNPTLSSGLDLQAFAACDHVIVTLSGDLQGKVDKVLASQGLKRRVLAGYSSFLAPQALLAKQTDMLFVCLQPVAELAMRYDPNLRIYECPIALPSVDLKQVWHERTHHDPLRGWLRQQIKDVSG